MTWDDCGLKVAKVCSTLTAAGLCGFLASRAEIYPQSPGMDTGRFGSATSTKAFSIRRQRVPFSAFLGPDSDTVTAVALLPDRLQGGLWLGFIDGGIAYLKDGQIRSSYNVADGLGNGAVMDLQLWFGRCCLGRDRGWFKPSERRPHHDSYQQERLALRRRSVGDRRQRSFLLVVHALAAWCGLRVPNWTPG